MTYKWESPYDWCYWKLDQWSEEELRATARTLLGHMGADDIQGLFQAEMDEDGYFEEAVMVQCPYATERCLADKCEHAVPHPQFDDCKTYNGGCPPCVPVGEEL